MAKRGQAERRGRLLAEPQLKVFAVLPCLAAWGPMSALAVAAVDVEPTGDDRTFWVTDAAYTGAVVPLEYALGVAGYAALYVTGALGVGGWLLGGRELG